MYGEVRATLVTRQVLLRVCNSTVKRRIPWTSLLSWIRVSCHVKNEETTHERGVCFVLPDSQECPFHSCAETCCREKHSTHLGSSVPLFLQNVTMTFSMTDGHQVFVRAGSFNETFPFCVSVDGSEFNPINTSRVSDVLRCSFVHMVGVVSVTMEQQVMCLWREHLWSIPRSQSTHEYSESKKNHLPRLLCVACYAEIIGYLSKLF